MTGASIVVLAVGLLAVHVMLDWAAQRGLLGELIPAEAMTSIGFEAREAQTFRGVATSNGWHALEGRVALHPRRSIRFASWRYR